MSRVRPYLSIFASSVGREIPSNSAARVFFQPESIKVVRITWVSTSSTVRATTSRRDLPTAATRASTLTKDAKQQEDLAAQLQGQVDKLKSAVAGYENDLVTLRARAKTAAATKKINRQLAKVDSGGTLAMLERMKERVEEDESLAAAYGEVAESGGTLDDEIDAALESKSGSDKLAELKAKMGVKA